MLARSTGFGRVVASSYMNFANMFLRTISFKEACMLMVLFDILEIGRSMSSCFPTSDSGASFKFR